MAFDDLDPDRNQRRREEQALLDRETRTQEQVDLLTLMDDHVFRRFTHRLLEQAGVFRLSYEKGDPYQTAFNEGGRNHGNWLLAQLMRDTPEQYAQMLKENSDGR